MKLFIRVWRWGGVRLGVEAGETESREWYVSRPGGRRRELDGRREASIMEGRGRKVRND